MRRNGVKKHGVIAFGLDHLNIIIAVINARLPHKIADYKSHRGRESTVADYLGNALAAFPKGVKPFNNVKG